MSERVEAKRAEVRENFEKLERGASEMEDGASRMRVLRQIAELKSRTAPLMAEQGQLRVFTVRDESGRYQGMDGSDARRAGIKATADARVRVVAARYGVDGDATVERHSGGVPSRGLAAQFAEAEARERERSRDARGEAPETKAERRQALDQMHGEIGRIYRDAHARAERDALTVAREGEGERPKNREDTRSGPEQAGGAEAGGQAARPAAESRQAPAADAARGVSERQEAERREAERREEERKIEERRRRERDGGRGL